MFEVGVLFYHTMIFFGYNILKITMSKLNITNILVQKFMKGLLFYTLFFICIFFIALFMFVSVTCSGIKSILFLVVHVFSSPSNHDYVPRNSLYQNYKLVLLPQSVCFQYFLRYDRNGLLLLH